MRFTSINIPEEFASKHGLKSVQMRGLGQVVLLAGKNGSGKTRLFNLIKEMFNRYPSLEERVSLNERIGYDEENSENIRQRIKSLQTQIYMSSKLEKIALEQELARLEGQLSTIKTDLENNKNRFKFTDYIQIEPEKGVNAIFDFVPKRLELMDAFIMSPADVENHAKFY